MPQISEQTNKEFNDFDLMKRKLRLLVLVRRRIGKYDLTNADGLDCGDWGLFMSKGATRKVGL